MVRSGTGQTASGNQQEFHLFSGVRQGRVGVDHGWILVDHNWILGEVFPAGNLKESRWRQPQAGGAIKRGGGTVGDSMVVHSTSLDGIWSLQTYFQFQV